MGLIRVPLTPWYPMVTGIMHSCASDYHCTNYRMVNQVTVLTSLVVSVTLTIAAVPWTMVGS